MHYYKLFTITAALVSGVASSCDNGTCEWFGSAPFCGSSGANYGDKDSDGRTYIASTKDATRSQIRDSGEISSSCFEDYGGGCITGYKRLWCKRFVSPPILNLNQNILLNTRIRGL
jgi:hypothetical protein